MSEQQTEQLAPEELQAAKEVLDAATGNREGEGQQSEAPKPKPPAKQATNPWDDPEVARTEIEKLRRENASSRTNAKAKAAEDAKRELAQTIGKALGIVEDEQVDPAELTKQLTKAQGEQRQAALELAIFRATPDAASANALLDSRSFLAKVADIDPTDGEAIKAAVGEVVQNNPALGKRVPAPNPAQGTSGNGPSSAGQLSESDVKRLYAERKYDEIEKARSEGRLDKLLGG